MMEDDKIKEMFSEFDPAMAPDDEFMRRLGRNLEAVELVRAHNAAQRNRSRRAIAVAVAVGFVAGFLFSLALPWIGWAMAAITPDSGTLLRTLADNYLVAAWILIAATSVFMAVNAYELMLSAAGVRRRARV